MHELDRLADDVSPPAREPAGRSPGRRSLTASLPPRRFPSGTGAVPSVDGRAPAEPDAAPEPGPAGPVQCADDPFALHELGGARAEPAAIAAAGMSGNRTSLPHREPIQRAFGAHDVSGVAAFVGGPAATASAQLGARAYAAGGQVAFAGEPDLFTAAHEAAHVVQQRGGVQLAGGVGARGDRYEQHADRVAEAVVAGRSAAPILDEVSGGGGGGPAVQRADAAPVTPADPGAPIALELSLGDLQAKGKAMLAGAIAAAAPGVGTKVELKAALRCPIPDVPGLWLSGRCAITVDHTTSGVAATMAGGVGLALGGPGQFADLLANLSVQGTGADATRAVEMLVLAFESTVRAIPDEVFMALASRALVLVLLIKIASTQGVRCADLLADLIWGKGHAAQVIAGMRDGESAQFDAGGELGGEAGDGKGGAEGGAGVIGRQRIEKKPGQAATTKQTALLAVNGKVSAGPVDGSFKLEAALTGAPAAKVEFGGNLKVTGTELGGLSTYAAFVAAGFAAIRQNLGSVTGDGARPAGALTGQLDALAGAVDAAIHAAVDLVTRALEQHGLGKAKTTVGLEGLVKLDTGSKKGSLIFSLVDGGQVAIPGGEGKASYKEKTELVTIPFAI